MATKTARKAGAKKVPKKVSVGRPSSYDSKYAEQAYRLALLGATDREVAAFFGVTERTVNRWKESEPTFCQSLKAGKVEADTRVADALYTRARGAEWVEEQAIKLKRVEYENGKRVLEEERIEVVQVNRAAPPDTTAAIFWLKNRRSQDWRDKQEVGSTNVDLSTWSEPEFLERVAAGEDVLKVAADRARHLAGQS